MVKLDVIIAATIAKFATVQTEEAKQVERNY